MNTQSDQRTKLELWRFNLIEKLKADGEPMFQEIPDAWFDKPAWACENGHISHRYLKSEEKGCICLECHESIMIVPPDLTEKELRKILKGDD